ncbi:MAG: hypothetical protein PVG39_18760 [Desulfobacteraceae bacterium]|jgi:hypothetical protein
MDMEEKKELSEKITLENKLELVIFSRYKHTAGDRCQVTFEAGADVEIKEDYFKDQALNNLDIKNVRSILGEKTSYLYSKTRNFIAEDEKDKIFEDLKQQFLDNILPYISSPSFPAKLIKRNYAIAEKEDMIRQQREEYMKNE